MYNNPISGIDYIWSTDVGVIDGTGLLTAQSTPTTGIVTANNGTITGFAIVDVIVPVIDHIIVTPDPVSLEVGAEAIAAPPPAPCERSPG